MAAIEMHVECDECGRALDTSFESANMVMKVKLCPICKGNFEQDALETFWKDLIKQQRKVAENHDIL